MQEEITQKVITLSVRTGKETARLTAKALQKALQKFLEAYNKSSVPHGKQTLLHPCTKADWR